MARGPGWLAVSSRGCRGLISEQLRGQGDKQTDHTTDDTDVDAGQRPASCPGGNAKGSFHGFTLGQVNPYQGSTWQSGQGRAGCLSPQLLRLSQNGVTGWAALGSMKLLKQSKAGAQPTVQHVLSAEHCCYRRTRSRPGLSRAVQGQPRQPPGCRVLGGLPYKQRKQEQGLPATSP